tara:strand:- start:2553 stop:2873 length:321 start_codon:yes stop_codon:yes gene_type:complete
MAKATSEARISNAILNPLLNDIEEITGVTRHQVLGNRRYDHYAFARFMVYLALREHEHGYSLAVIGRTMNRDHGAVIHGIRNIKARAKLDKRVRKLLGRLKKKGWL